MNYLWSYDVYHLPPPQSLPFLLGDIRFELKIGTDLLKIWQIDS